MDQPWRKNKKGRFYKPNAATNARTTRLIVQRGDGRVDCYEGAATADGWSGDNAGLAVDIDAAEAWLRGERVTLVPVRQNWLNRLLHFY